MSDTPDVHEQYSRNFTDDATFILASRISKGRDGEALRSDHVRCVINVRLEILQTRKSMWSAVASRRHTVCKIFPFGDNANEVMLYGQVAYDLKDGGHSEKDWAARAVLTKPSNDGPLRLQFYQVYLVCITRIPFIALVLTNYTRILLHLPPANEKCVCDTLFSHTCPPILQ
jgi:hypothetical protein